MDCLQFSKSLPKEQVEAEIVSQIAKNERNSFLLTGNSNYFNNIKK